MNQTKGMAMRTKEQRGRFNKHSKRVRITAVFLAVIMAFSAIGANLSAIIDMIDLLTAYADSGLQTGEQYYNASITLYDYYSEKELGASDRSLYFDVFNKALYYTGYTTGAGSLPAGVADPQTELAALDYYPLYLGREGYGDSVMEQNKAQYNYSYPVNHQGFNGQNGGAAMGLVYPELMGGIVTQGTNGWMTLPYFDEDFLTTPIRRLVSPSLVGLNNSQASESLGKVSEKLNFKFRYNSSSKLYEYNSLENALHYDDALNTFVVQNGLTTGVRVNDALSNSGFFPWSVMAGESGSSQNYGYAAKFEIDFTMTENGFQPGQTPSDDAELVFKFRGDDDVWVFVDGKLVLDVGGAHDAVSGEIHFGNGSSETKTYTPYSKTMRVKTPLNTYGTCTIDGNGSETPLSTLLGDKFSSFYSDSTATHKMTVFYIERGTRESNCMISFNFEPSDTLTIANKLDMSNVNSELLEKTEQVAAKEAIAYQVQSNGGTRTGTSVDAGPINHDDTLAATVTNNDTVTLRFQKSASDNTQVLDPMQVSKNAKAKLPSGYSLSTLTTHVSGWKVVGGDDTTYTSYDVETSDVTFYPVYTNISTDAFKSLIAMPNPPTLLEVKNVSGLDELENAGTQDTDYYATSDFMFFNMTKNPKTSSNLYFKKPDRIPGYKNDGNGYTAYGDASVDQDGGTFRVSTNHFHVLNVSEKSYWAGLASAVTSSYTNTSNGAWIEAYSDLYEALDAKRQSLITAYSNNPDSVDSAALQEYVSAINQYYQALPSNTTVAQLNAMKAALAYDYDYAYNTTKQTFYVYSSSSTTPVVKITNGPDYGLEENEATVTPLVNPPYTEGDPTVTGGTYYSVKVPANIVATDQGGSGPTQYIDLDLKITVGADIVTVSSATIESGIAGQVDPSKMGYCYYAGDYWSYISAGVPTYSFTDYKLVWFYGDPGSITVSGSGVSSTTATASADSVSGYYIASIPTKVGNDMNSNTTDVTIAFGSYSGSVPSGTLNGNAMCYFSSRSTWYQLYTIMAQVVTFWDAPHLFLGSSGDSVWSQNIVAMTNATGHYYYFYTPSFSGADFYIQGFASDPNWGNSHWRTANKSSYSISGDTYFAFDETGKETVDGIEYVAWPTVFSTIPSAVESYTAAYRAANAPSSGGRASGGASGAPMVPPVSGGNNDGNGKFVGTSGSYSVADGVNFKLYNTTDPNALDARSVRRRTGMENNEGNTDTYYTAEYGKFYIHFGQSAKFTQQFNRNAGLRIAQTGDSAFYTDNDEVLPSKASDTNKTLKAKASAKTTALYNRYRTTWVLSDKEGNTLVSSRESYNAYNYQGSEANPVYHGASAAYPTLKNNSPTYYNAGAIMFQNLGDTAGNVTSIALKAEFTNSVITGDLYIQKVLDSDALSEIEKYCTANPEKETTYKANLAFTFGATFSEIFGDSSDTEQTGYNGSYYIVDKSGYYYNASGEKYTRATEDGVVVYKKNGTASGVTATVAGVVSPYGSSMKLYYADASQADGTSVVSGGTVKMIKIEGIPVETKYVINETVPDSSDGTPTFEVNNTKFFKVDNAATDVETDSTAQILPVLKSAAVDEASGAIATYYELVSGTFEGADAKAKVTNSPVAYYIVLQKTIDKMYYYTVKGNKATDNPADLYDTTAKVGGATGSSTDANGYQEATGANPSFVFKIKAYDGETVASEFTESMGFTATGTQTILIKANTAYKYEITEDTDWSWKYSLASSQLNAETATTNAQVDVAKGTGKYTQTYDGKTHCAVVAYTDNRQQGESNDVKDVEGDTSFAVNKAKKAS